MPFGLEVPVEDIVLTRGRDFKWSLQNLDENDQPLDFDPGQLYFELQTGGGSSAFQTITQVGASSGTYKLKIGTEQTPAISHDDSELSIQSALEQLPSIPQDSVRVRATYRPKWVVTVDWNDGVPLAPAQIQAANLTVNAVFDGLEFLAGHSVSLTGIYASSSFTFILTYNGFFAEPAFVNFVIESVAGTVNTAMNLVEYFSGNILDVNEIYCPTRTFTVEFVNDMAETYVPPIEIDDDLLIGYNPRFDTFVNSKGQSPISKWNFDIDGDLASIKIESEEADRVAPRVAQQLVFLPAGETAGGDPVSRGQVRVLS